MTTLGAKKLSYVEVAKYVGTLADDTLTALAQGPLPDDVPETAPDYADCRLCSALRSLGTPAAEILLEWHDCHITGFELVEELRRHEPRGVVSKVRDVVGALAYARCCAIYAAAAAELERRRGRQEQLGPLVDAIERALPTNLYVRIGCGLEKASRPTIAATAALALQGDRA